MQDLLERVLAIAAELGSAGVPHSFGGAIALGYHAEFRATHDIDINLYVDVNDVDVALAALEAAGVPAATAEQRRAIRRDAQTRLLWDRVPVDLFFSNLPFHQSCCERRVARELLGRPVDVLGAEDLLICKVAFGRAKDLRDIDALLDARGPELDVPYVLRWIDEICEPSAESVVALVDSLARRALLPAERDEGTRS